MYTKYEEIKDQLEIFVKESFSWSDVCKKIGKSQTFTFLYLPKGIG